MLAWRSSPMHSRYSPANSLHHSNVQYLTRMNVCVRVGGTAAAAGVQEVPAETGGGASQHTRDPRARMPPATRDTAHETLTNAH